MELTAAECVSLIWAPSKTLPMPYTVSSLGSRGYTPRNDLNLDSRSSYHTVVPMFVICGSPEMLRGHEATTCRMKRYSPVDLSDKLVRL
jgi:hypothetical protein